MKKEECFLVGQILKPHGLKGALTVFLDVDNPDEYMEIEALMVEENNSLTPYIIEEIQLHGDKAIVKFEEIDTIEKAKILAGKEIHLPLSLLPELTDQQFYFHEIIGFDIIDSTMGKIGTVAEVFSFSSQNLIQVFYQKKEVLIPITDQLLTKVDRDNKTLFVNLPDGLLEIYLENEN